jgi:hypothetical protein
VQNSDIAYIKAMLWGIVGVCRGPELPDPLFWIIFLNILFYGIEFVFCKYKENNSE